MKRRLKDAIKRFLFRVYKLGTRLGVHIMPVHYYSPVPDVIELERTRDEWARKSRLPGLDVDLDQQLEALRAVCLPFQDEYAGNAAYREGVAQSYGPGYGYIEAQALHGVIRHYKPRRIVEVGSGVSTHCMLAAMNLNRSEGTDSGSMTCVEPYPSARLKQTAQIELLARKVQAVPADFFGQLGNGDFLFIDSSHAVRPGGDVNYLILEVLPVLQPGVIVHVHDIHLPYDYQPNVLKTFLHWSETSLLRAYLAHNERMTILFCLSHLHHDRQDGLKEIFPEYDPAPSIHGLNPDSVRPFEHPPQHVPSSIYLRTR